MTSLVAQIIGESIIEPGELLATCAELKSEYQGYLCFSDGKCGIDIYSMDPEEYLGSITKYDDSNWTVSSIGAKPPPDFVLFPTAQDAMRAVLTKQSNGDFNQRLKRFARYLDRKMS